MSWSSRNLIITLGAAELALGTGASSAADNNTHGYIEALEQAELIDRGGSPVYQFRDSDSALFTGDWVCQQVAQGSARGSVVDERDHSDGMLFSPRDAGVIFDAATTFLC